MIALRVVFRMGWALPNPATAMNGGRTLVPFAYLEPAVAKTTYNATVAVKEYGTDTAIAGATVDLNGSRKKTGADGTAVFNLFDGTYPVKIKADGHKAATGTVNVSGAAATLDISLVKA